MEVRVADRYRQGKMFYSDGITAAMISAVTLIANVRQLALIYETSKEVIEDEEVHYNRRQTAAWLQGITLSPFPQRLPMGGEWTARSKSFAWRAS